METKLIQDWVLYSGKYAILMEPISNLYMLKWKDFTYTERLPHIKRDLLVFRTSKTTLHRTEQLKNPPPIEPLTFNHKPTPPPTHIQQSKTHKTNKPKTNTRNDPFSWTGTSVRARQLAPRRSINNEINSVTQPLVNGRYAVNGRRVFNEPPALHMCSSRGKLPIRRSVVPTSSLSTGGSRWLLGVGGSRGRQTRFWCVCVRFGVLFGVFGRFSRFGIGRGVAWADENVSMCYWIMMIFVGFWNVFCWRIIEKIIFLWSINFFQCTHFDWWIKNAVNILLFVFVAIYLISIFFSIHYKYSLLLNIELLNIST